MSPLSIVVAVLLPLGAALIVATVIAWLVLRERGPNTAERDAYACCGAPSDGQHELSCEQLSVEDFAEELGIAVGVDSTPSGAHDRAPAVTDAQRDREIEAMYAAMTAAPRELPIVPADELPYGVAVYPGHPQYRKK